VPDGIVTSRYVGSPGFSSAAAEVDVPSSVVVPTAALSEVELPQAAHNPTSVSAHTHLLTKNLL